MSGRPCAEEAGNPCWSLPITQPPSTPQPPHTELSAALSASPSPRRRSMCRLGDGAWEGGRGGGLAVHPKDAEELVAEVCAHGLAPNATTRRTLDRIWAVHDQLHG